MLFSRYQNDGTTFEFLYDESGHPAGFWYKQGSGDWNLYFYVTNLQGDITKIIDEDGSSIGTYSYDAWGKVTSVSGTIAQANPLRYRGYYYDEETGFYQLGSRYYDPEIGRFISADDPELLSELPYGLSDKNLFAYCDNNPVSRIDINGALWDEIIEAGKSYLKAAIVVAEVGVVAGLTTALLISGGTAAPAVLPAIAETVMQISVGLAGTGASLIGIGIGGQLVQAKGHQKNMRDTGLVDLSDEEVVLLRKQYSKDKSPEGKKQKKRLKRKKRQGYKGI